METFNPINASKKVLKECHVIKDRHIKVKQIHPLEGF